MTGQALPRAQKLIAAFLFVLALAAAGPASAQTTVDDGAKPWLIGGGLAAFVMFFFFGAVLLRSGSRLSRLGDAARQWPTTTGKVLSSEVVKKQGDNDGVYDYYAPEIRYAYVVDGQTYVGRTIKFGLTRVHYLKEDAALEWVESYPVGATPPVRYDPREPKTSALEFGQQTGGRLLLSGFLCLMVAAGAALFTVYVAWLPAE